MSTTADQLEQTIKSLPDIEELRLVDAILADLGRPDPEIDRTRATKGETLKRPMLVARDRCKMCSYATT